MAKIHLTSELVKVARCPAEKRKYDLFDSSCKGLMLEIRATGGKTWYLRYQDKRGRTRQLRLAHEQDMSLHQVRKLAEHHRSLIALGHDPCDEKEQLRKVPTFAEFVESQYLPYVRSYKRSWQTDVSLLKNHLLPRFGKCYMDEIGRQDILELHRERHVAGAAPGSANRLLILMRYIFNLALKWELAGVKVNPCKAVPLMQENNERDRYLSVAEVQRLYESVCRRDNPMLMYIVPMLILTGARKREVLDAQWADFDIERRIWRIPMSKSGKVRYVPLSDGALSVLNALPRKSECKWAFANPDTGKPYVSVYYAWNTARQDVGLADVRMHDLRHSFASLLINSGRTLYEVQQILGHSQLKTTQRYAHLSQDTLLAAANTAAEAVEAVMLPIGRVS